MNDTHRQADMAKVKHILETGVSILDGKNEDYAGGGSAFSNFTFTGMCLDEAVKQGLTGAHLAFLALITTKLARLISLLGEDKLPNNETLDDTFIDGANYVALWGGYVASEAARDGAWVELEPESIDEAEAAIGPSYYLDAQGRINPYVGEFEVAESTTVSPKNSIGVYFDGRPLSEQEIVFYNKSGKESFRGCFWHRNDGVFEWSVSNPQVKERQLPNETFFMPGFDPEPQNEPSKSFLSVAIPYEGYQDIRFFNPIGVEIWRASYYVNHMGKLSWTNAQKKKRVS